MGGQRDVDNSIYVASKSTYMTCFSNNDVAYSLVSTDYKEPQIIAETMARGGVNNNTVGAICARDYKGVGNQYVDEGKIIIQNI